MEDYEDFIVPLKYDQIKYQNLFKTIIYIDGVEYEISKDFSEISKRSIYGIIDGVLCKSMTFLERFAKSVKFDGATMEIVEEFGKQEVEWDIVNYSGVIEYESLQDPKDKYCATFAFGKLLEIVKK